MSGKRHQDGGEQAVPSKDGRADDISYPNDVEFAPGKRPAPVSMRRGRALLPVDGLAVAAADKVLRKRGFAQATLIRAWPTIVGETFARVSIPEKISYPPHRRSGGVLHLRVERGAALEIQHQEPRLIERINATFGYAAISRITIRQGPLPYGAPPARPAWACKRRRSKSASPMRFQVSPPVRFEGLGGSGFRNCREGRCKRS